MTKQIKSITIKWFEQIINSYLKIEKKRDEKGRKYTETKLILTVEERKWGSDMVMIETAREEYGDWKELEKWKVKTKERERERDIQIFYFEFEWLFLILHVGKV